MQKKKLARLLKVQVGISFAKVSGLLLCRGIFFLFSGENFKNFNNFNIFFYFRGNTMYLYTVMGKSAAKSIVVFAFYITAQNS